MNTQQTHTHYVPQNLLTGHNLKIQKTTDKASVDGFDGVKSYIMHLAANYMMGGKVNTCPHATPGCAAACLTHAGHGRFTRAQKARRNKSDFFYNDQTAFMTKLYNEIAAKTRNNPTKLIAIRLNGTSDLAWEFIKFDMGDGEKNIFEHFLNTPNVVFYDYTKIAARSWRQAEGKMPANYHLVFSRAETDSNQRMANKVLETGGGVAVVFGGKVPETYQGWPVINGDETDARWLDRQEFNVTGGYIVGLTVKGLAAKKDKSNNFIVW